MIAISATLIARTAEAQTQGSKDTSSLPKWKFDASTTIGAQSQDYTTVNTVNNYQNSISTSNTGHLEYKNGVSMCVTLQAGYFFDKKRHWGLGTGVMYQYQSGEAQLHNFRVEYQERDFVDNDFRQIITANELSERVHQSNINIPLVLKYQTKLSGRIGFNMDAGVMFGIVCYASYKTTASLDYEAIYKFQTQPWGGTTTVYDNSTIPDQNDWVITREIAERQNIPGGAEAYFDTLRGRGYSVALNVHPDNSGTVKYKASTGLILHPSVNLTLTKKLAIDLGLTYMNQSYTKTTEQHYVISKWIGDYHSPLNTVSSVNVETLGVNVGVTYDVW